MSLVELNLQSGLWQTLLLYDSDSGWTLNELADICRTLIDEEEIAAYFKPGEEDQLRKFIKERPQYFKYDPEEEKVSLPENSTSTVMEECLVEFMALQVKASSGSLNLAEITFEKYKPLLPKPLAEHMHIIYGESLALFLRTHPLSFTFSTQNTVKLAPGFKCFSILTDDNNMKVVCFYLGLLQKIGATKDKPCLAHVLLKYVPYMEQDAREFLRREYLGNLNIFFLLNCRYFQTTKPEKCSVCPKYPQAVDYALVAHLKRQLRIKNAATDETSLTLPELVSKGKESWIPAVHAFFATDNVLKKLKGLLHNYPNVFKLLPDGRVCLQGMSSPCEQEWNPSLELLAAIYFTEMLKDIGSSSPSNPICFNYILSCVDLAPEEISGYLRDVFPGVDIIDLFHLHPNVFDLSSTNCVSLKLPPAKEVLLKKEVVKALSTHYASRLMKYAHVTPDLFLLCVQTAPSALKFYCTNPEKNRLQSVLALGKKLSACTASDCNTVVDDFRTLFSGCSHTATTQCKKALVSVTALGVAATTLQLNPISMDLASAELLRKKRRRHRKSVTKSDSSSTQGGSGDMTQTTSVQS
ncbi:unnamed protein product [Ixodes hexagonus]